MASARLRSWIHRVPVRVDVSSQCVGHPDLSVRIGLRLRSSGVSGAASLRSALATQHGRLWCRDAVLRDSRLLAVLPDVSVASLWASGCCEAAQSPVVF